MTHTNGTGPAEKLLIKRLKVSGLLSFGPRGIDLEMRGLNVLIGPNGSGKSNLLEMLALLRAAPRDLAEPMRAMGGVTQWLWKGGTDALIGSIQAVVTSPGSADLTHEIAMRPNGPWFELADEQVRSAGQLHYTYGRDTEPALFDREGQMRAFSPYTLSNEKSILSEIRDPERYPRLASLQDAYAGIRMFRNWSFGPGARLRGEQSTHNPADFLQDGGANLALVLSNIHGKVPRSLRESLARAYEGLEDISFYTSGGTIQMFLVESGDRLIPATRLSDGTLRYLFLLALLLHPEPPPLIAIEEPELGLHPDIIRTVADLLKDAATRTQLVVTTHSRALIDALSDQPESVVVCEKHEGESVFERLDPDRLGAWLEQYSLGELWSRGELGGNRW